MNGDLSPREKAKDLASKKSADDRISPRSDASSHGSSTSTKHRDVRCLLFPFFSLSLFFCWLLLLLGAIIIDWKRFSKGTLAVISRVKFIALRDEIYWLILFFFSNTANWSWTWHYSSIINFIMYTWLMGFLCVRSLPLHLHYACFWKSLLPFQSIPNEKASTPVSKPATPTSSGNTTPGPSSGSGGAIKPGVKYPLAGEWESAPWRQNCWLTLMPPVTSCYVCFWVMVHFDKQDLFNWRGDSKF